jgi:hypothetical protein
VPRILSTLETTPRRVRGTRLNLGLLTYDNMRSCPRFQSIGCQGHQLRVWSGNNARNVCCAIVKAGRAYSDRPRALFIFDYSTVCWSVHCPCNRGRGNTLPVKIIVDNRGTYFMLRLGRASALTATRRVQSSFPGLSASKVVDRRARKKTAKQIICAI